MSTRICGASLAREFDDRQMMELVFAIGTYVMLSAVVNSLRISLEAGPGGDDLAKQFGAPERSAARPRRT